MPSGDRLQHLLIQIVQFHESNTCGVVGTTHNRGVVACWQRCNYCRLARLRGSMPAVLNRADLARRDDLTDDRRLTVIIRTDQCSGRSVQLQSWTSNGSGTPNWLS
jgi:wyosine [tRNA(Phe)-imidazoG37] synthetase (radical SAM superfamily)